MTETAQPTETGTGSAPSLHTTEAAQRRLRRRYGFETRFKLMGVLAIALSALALVALLWTVVYNAMGAVFATHITLPVGLDAQAIDPKGTGDPAAIRGGDFDGVIRAALRSALPFVKGRRDRRQLYKLVSDGNAVALRHDAMDDPGIIGTTQKIPLLASDDVDLWVKGYHGTIERLPATGQATPTATSGTVKVIVEADVLQPLLTLIKQSLQRKAAALRENAERQQRGVDYYERQLTSTTDAEKKDQFQNEIAGYRHRANLALEQAAAADARASRAGGRKTLKSDLPSFLVKINGGVVKATQVTADSIEGPALIPLRSTETAQPGAWQLEMITTSEAARRLSDKQIAWVERLREEGAVSRFLNWQFLTSSNSREAELAGVWGAAVGSFWTMLVTFLLAFPIGVMAAIYLEEFAPKNAVTDFIEVNINNLAAVPSIVFGLLGLAVFISFFGVPRSTALAGGIVLALMTLPTIIIASRAAIKAVPPSIREAALGVGASRVQAVSHHVLPLAMPGILTGTIIGMAQALGETAPLLMIGMFAFIRETPTGVLDPATALPVQIYQWSDFPEILFTMKTGAAIVVLLVFLIAMNALAIFLRRRFERKW